MNLPLRLLFGAIGGFSATAPMTATMLALHRRLPPAKQYPLPPREIAAQAVQTHDRNVDSLVTVASHFAYGAAMGVAYAAVAPSPSQKWGVKGVGAGLAVWSFSYFLLLPLLRILRPAHRHPPERNLLMVIAHLVWGAVLGGFYATIVRDEQSKGLIAGSPFPHHDQA
ncbi:MAG TPA: DUF1440 domain-containing protein [Chthoniobacterales bacterium]|jgi:uncharacterized membrane protein YagU involved in acid resistance